MKTAFMAFIVLGTMLFVAGGLFAIGNVSSLTNISSTRWTGSATAWESISEGGNISSVNIQGQTLTDRWAAYSGNVTGSINLTDGSDNVYTWVWTAASGGEVCVSTSSGFLFDNATSIPDAVEVNTVWAFGTAADNATNTYNVSTCNLTFATATVTSTISSVLQGSSSFQSCALNDGTNSTKANFAFCTTINNAGTNYKGVGANYELLVPTAAGAGTETYYFFVELN